MKLVDHFESAAKVYLILELCQGGDLRQRVQDGPIPELQCKDMFMSILRAVEYLHEEIGLIHRDLKLDNILLLDAASSTVKLGDFGVSKVLQLDLKVMGSENLTTHVGTPLYLAPEILAGASYGKEVDIWSLGVILHFMLTSHPPWDSDRHTNSYQQHEDFQFLSPSARAFVSKLLSVEPQKRPTISEG